MKRFTTSRWGILLCLMTLPLMATSCPDDYLDDINWGKDTDVQGLELTNIDNSHQHPIVAPGDSCPRSVYVLRIKPILPDSVLDDYTCSLIHPIERLTIRTLTPLDSVYGAGEDVTRCFRMMPGYAAPGTSGGLRLGSQYTTALATHATLYAMLVLAPEPGDYQFDVTLSLYGMGNCSDTITATSPVIHLY